METGNDHTEVQFHSCGIIMISAYDIQVQGSRLLHKDEFLNSLPSADTPYYSFLYHITQHLILSKMEAMPFVEFNVLILGVYRGVDMAHVAQAMKDLNVDEDSVEFSVVGIDLQETSEAIDVYELYSDYIDYISGVSSIDPSVEEELSSIYDAFDIIFFDSLHERQHLEKEVDVWLKYTKDSCVLLFDDVQLDNMDEIIRNIDGVYIPLNHLHKTHGFAAVVINRGSSND